MAGITQYLANKLLDHVFRGVVYTPPASIWTALYSSTPTFTAPGTELSTVATGYQRQQAFFTTPAAAGVLADTAVVTFPVAQVDWAAVVAIALCDAASGGNILTFGPQNPAQIVFRGNTFTVPIGNLLNALS